MKQGSADDPFAEDFDTADAESGAETESGSEDSNGTVDTGTEPARVTQPAGATESTPQSGTLPYIYSRESVKDGRQQRPIFLRDDIEDGIPELVENLEATFGETVYRTDVLEAAVVIAQENPDLIEAKLAEWGYGWE